jgi:hypothetical protein
LILALELPLLTLITFAFWYPSPTRDQWLWLLYLLIPVYAARWLVYRRLWTWIPITPWLLIFIALLIINIALGIAFAADGVPDAPYTRGWIMLGRPVLGMAIFTACVEHARVRQSMQGLLTRTIWLALGLGLLALGSTQWTDKAKHLALITDVLPEIRNFPGAENGFNPNEIAGAVSWLLPIVTGLALYRWRDKRARRDEVTIAWLLLGVALFLGQSRGALLGTLLALAILCFFLLQKYWRYVGLAGVFGIGILQIISVAVAPLPDSFEGQSDTATSNLTVQADESIGPRLRIWQSALQMIWDYPLTGVGFTFFRYEPMRTLYPVEGVERGILVHAHNEWLQMGTDFGVPGAALYLVWGVVIFQMVRAIWKRGNPEARVVALSVGCGLLAHGVFGLLDAIPLADRFAFLFWWTLGLLGAQHVTVSTPALHPTPPQT